MSPSPLLDSVLAEAQDQTAFQDSDGMISFVNIGNKDVLSTDEYKTGRDLCDKVCNFYPSLQIKVLNYLKNNPTKVLPGDSVPSTQWDPAVSHYIQYILTESGGITGYKVGSETYSYTQSVVDFSTNFLKFVFDTFVLPKDVVDQITSFVQGIGQSLRVSWTDRGKHYQNVLLGQCHEAVPVNSTGTPYVYFPKIKYYYISVDASQQAFTTSCGGGENITFNFTYDTYITALTAAVIHQQQPDYGNFVAILDKAQGIAYKDANNKLDAVVDGPSSQLPAINGANEFGVYLPDYPQVSIRTPISIEDILNGKNGLGNQ